MTGSGTDFALKPDAAPQEVVLRAEHISKSFKLPTEQVTGLKQAVVNRFKGIKGYKEQKVLKDISFQVHKGDFLGIVGRNGSGKSTLLKIVSQIYYPNTGSIAVSGKLVPFIELGVGFNPELTGRENVYLNGALLGFTREDIAQMYDEIVEFAELEEFMDQKLKNYSSGMQVRLAFSVAIKAQGDILVLDEVLAVGDEAFQRKCNNFFAQIKKDKTKTVILVTHSMENVKKYCNRAILIKDGHIAIDGDKNEVADQYSLENVRREEQAEKPQDTQSHPQGGDEDEEKPITYEPGLSAQVPHFRISAIDSPMVQGFERFHFALDYEYYGEEPYLIVFNLLDIKRGGIVYDTGADYQFEAKGKQRLEGSLPVAGFTDGNFRIIASLRKRKEQDDSGNPVYEPLAYSSEKNSLDFMIRKHNGKGYNPYGLLAKKQLDFEVLPVSSI